MTHSMNCVQTDQFSEVFRVRYIVEGLYSIEMKQDAIERAHHQR